MKSIYRKNLHCNKYPSNTIYHAFIFSRIFSFLIGETYRQYVLKRKINHSLSLLDKNESIISTAYYYGFSHPESYSRAFKQIFGISPKQYQLDREKISSLDIGRVISRDLVNFKGNLLIKSEYEYHDDCLMVGDEICIDKSDEFWLNDLSQWCNNFLLDTKDNPLLDNLVFYNQIECISVRNNYIIKILKRPLKEDESPPLRKYIVKGGWFAKFHYEGLISDYYDCLENDINKWIKNKDEKLERVGNGVLVKYSLIDTSGFDIYVRLNRILENEIADENIFRRIDNDKK